MKPLRKKSWSPYVVGVGIGVLSWFAFASANQPIGVTSSFEHTMALAGKAIAPASTEHHGYYTDPQNRPRISWEWMLVLGLFFGSLTSAVLGRDRTQLAVPQLWAWRFGANPTVRLAAAFLGGALMMFGARLARGCTSGHGISGALQLAVSSWLFVVLIFSVAIATALALYGREGRNRV